MLISSFLQPFTGDQGQDIFLRVEQRYFRLIFMQRAGHFLRQAIMCAYSYVSVKVAQSCSTLCNPMHCTVHGILQARILEWVSLSLLQGIFPTQGLKPGLPRCRQILYQLSNKGSPRILEWVAAAAAAKLLQSCPTLCDPIDSSPPGSAVLGIFQARSLEWVAISFSSA